MIQCLVAKLNTVSSMNYLKSNSMNIITHRIPIFQVDKKYLKGRFLLWKKKFLVNWKV